MTPEYFEMVMTNLIKYLEDEKKSLVERGFVPTIDLVIEDAKRSLKAVQDSHEPDRNVNDYE